jgi:hypothetical protein
MEVRVLVERREERFLRGIGERNEREVRRRGEI